MVISDFRIAQLVLTNYKNYTFQRFEFGTKLNFIVGNNGTGKTSLLDAIYYTCFTKSYLSSSDILNVRFTTEFFRIETHLDVNNTPHLVEVKYSKNEKKEILLDKSKLEKLADYIGKFPCVIITPDDSQLILGSSELRRKFLDASLSQYSSEYFQQLLLYNKILAQRNALLKSFYENRFFDKNLLDVYNQQLISSGNIIYTYRKDFIQQFNQIFCLFYHQIFEGNEEVSVQYTSDLHLKNFDSVLEDSISHDRNAQRTTKGIHTDDLVFELNHLPIRKIGSQGQQKTFLLSLKLAQYDLLKTQKQLTPLLLLDDIFDKLDIHRIAKIIQLVNKDSIGQVFISDTDKNRIQHFINENNITQYKLIHLGDI